MVFEIEPVGLRRQLVKPRFEQSKADAMRMHDAPGTIALTGAPAIGAIVVRDNAHVGQRPQGGACRVDADIELASQRLVGQPDDRLRSFLPVLIIGGVKQDIQQEHLRGVGPENRTDAIEQLADFGAAVTSDRRLGRKIGKIGTLGRLLAPPGR